MPGNMLSGWVSHVTTCTRMIWGNRYIINFMKPSMKTVFKVLFKLEAELLCSGCVSVPSKLVLGLRWQCTWTRRTTLGLRATKCCLLCNTSTVNTKCYPNFQDDDGHVHWSTTMCNWHDEHSEAFLHFDWPTKSSDLNPIKNPWDCLEQWVKCQRNHPTDLAELKDLGLQEWMKMLITFANWWHPRQKEL